MADAIVGRPLFPATGTMTVDGLHLLASFDGITFDNQMVFEYKLLNPKVVGMIQQEDLMGSHFWQLEQQLLVANKAKCVLFVCSSITRFLSAVLR